MVYGEDELDAFGLPAASKALASGMVMNAVPSAPGFTGETAANKRGVVPRKGFRGAGTHCTLYDEVTVRKRTANGLAKCDAEAHRVERRVDGV